MDILIILINAILKGKIDKLNIINFEIQSCWDQSVGVVAEEVILFNIFYFKNFKL